jgi:hypothetical protein
VSLRVSELVFRLSPLQFGHEELRESLVSEVGMESERQKLLLEASSLRTAQKFDQLSDDELKETLDANPKLKDAFESVKSAVKEPPVDWKIGRHVRCLITQVEPGGYGAIVEESYEGAVITNKKLEVGDEVIGLYLPHTMKDRMLIHHFGPAEAD